MKQFNGPKVGIEKINVYGSSMCLSQEDLARFRGRDPEKTVKDFSIQTRSLNPPYEDTVTMGANAARPMLTQEDINSIGLLIVGTEGSIDFGKPISTNIHSALGLQPNCRSYETKHACYSGVAALDSAINWIASGLNKGKKALIIASDFSRKHFQKDHEFVLGGAASAILVSDNPQVVEFELQHKGTWTADVYDTFRPSATIEMGNNEVSLFAYQDAVEGALDDYLRSFEGTIDLNTYFKSHIYHMPFPQMAFVAHRVLCQKMAITKKSEIQEHFNRKVAPTFAYSQRVGAAYGASNFVSLCGLIDTSSDLKACDRISFFSYGSGCIGEFYSAKLMENAAHVVGAMKIEENLNARMQVTVAQYEEIENLRESYIERATYVPDFTIADHWFKKHYEGKELLYLKEVNNFYRKYAWS